LPVVAPPVGVEVDPAAGWIRGSGLRRPDPYDGERRCGKDRTQTCDPAESKQLLIHRDLPFRIVIGCGSGRTITVSVTATIMPTGRPAREGVAANGLWARGPGEADDGALIARCAF